MELSKQAFLVHGSRSLPDYVLQCVIDKESFNLCQHILGVGGGQIQYVDTADAGKWSGGKGLEHESNKMIIIIINLTEIFLNPGLIPSHRDQLSQKILLMMIKSLFETIKCGIIGC